MKQVIVGRMVSYEVFVDDDTNVSEYIASEDWNDVKPVSEDITYAVLDS